MTIKQQVVDFLVDAKLTTRSAVAAAFPGVRPTTLCLILSELREAGVVKLSGPYRDREIKLLRKPERRRTHQDALLQTIAEFGGSASFGQLKEALGVSANLLAATIAVASNAGKVVKSGERRSYRYSVAGGIEVPRPKRIRLVTSVFDMGATHA